MAAPTTPIENGTPAGASRYVVGVSGVAAVAGLLFGFDTAVINGALVFLKEQFQLTNFQTEVAATSLLVGCMFGSGMAGPLTDRQGRKKVLLFAALLFCVSSVGAALPRNLPEFIAARFAAGLAIGVASVLAPMYIAEIAPPASRGRLVTLNQMAIVTGILASYFVNWLLSSAGTSNWRWMFATAAVPSLAFFLMLLRIPESPRWLLTRGRSGEALAVLRHIFSDCEAREQAREIQSSIAEETGSMRELLEPHLRRPLLIAVSLAVFSQVTGINTVIYYGSIFFKEHGGRPEASEALGVNVLIGVVNVLCTIVAIALIDRAGRKPLLLAGSAGMGVALVTVSVALRVTPVPAQWVLGGVLVYVACFSASLGAVTWVYIAEIFPTAVRGRAMSVATVCIWAACTMVTLTFLTIIEHLGASAAFLIYASLCVATFLFVWFLTPETKGRTLEEIARNWRRET